jgi:YegS/Rv2252/BmrU family lipid kinase
MEPQLVEVPAARPRLVEVPGQLLSPAVLLVNAKARSGDGSFARVYAQLEAQGLALADAQAVSEADTLPGLVGDAVKAGARLVIVGGGDGTLSCAANVLAGTRVHLGVVPLGTGNDFARSLGIPRSVRAACAVLAEGYSTQVDLGCVGGRFFLNAVSLGVSAQLTQTLPKRLKRAAGKLAYPLGAAHAALKAQPFRLRLRVDGEAFAFEAVQLVIGNGRYMGGGRLVAPDAALDDRQLDVYAVRASRHRGDSSQWRALWNLARVALRLPLGQHVDDEDVLHLRTRSIQVEADPPQAANADGEPAGRTPFQVTLAPKALNVVAPSVKLPG